MRVGIGAPCSTSRLVRRGVRRNKCYDGREGKHEGGAFSYDRKVDEKYQGGEVRLAKIPMGRNIYRPLSLHGNKVRLHSFQQLTERSGSIEN